MTPGVVLSPPEVMNERSIKKRKKAIGVPSEVIADQQPEESHDAQISEKPSDGEVSYVSNEQASKEKSKKKRRKIEPAGITTESADIPAKDMSSDSTKSDKKNMKKKKNRSDVVVEIAAVADLSDAGPSSSAKSESPQEDEKKKRRKKEKLDPLSPEDVVVLRKELTVTVAEGQTLCPPPVRSFSETGFPVEILKLCTASGYDKPTSIQAQGWPVAMAGHDLIGLAATGSGKTLAFVLPALVHLEKSHTPDAKGPRILVLAPTRELAIQIHSVADKFCQVLGFKCVSIYGGVPKHPQMQQLRAGPDIIVATPGRLIDMLECHATTLKNCTYLVMDEADRMLDMGFQPQIKAIMSYVEPNQKPQTLMFSATWPKEVQQLAAEYLNHNKTVRIIIGSVELAANHKVAQVVEVCDPDEKRQKLHKLLEQWKDKGRILVFALYKKSCEWLCRSLWNDGWSCASLHGDKSQSERDQVLRDFKGGKRNILVATDVAARGLDVKDIFAVVNYEMPLQIEDYVHRIGRTGRANSSGQAVTLFTPDDARTPGHAHGLINILREANQPVNPELERMAQRAPGRKNRPKKDDDTFKAWGQRSTHVKF
mmetsp:Transcript_18864/g.30961  ORF Transcript_18864/g.30961 Transcript_18864/m.30961 type:complete len:596 (-) Transcript_18864:746-2533(-)